MAFPIDTSFRKDLAHRAGIGYGRTVNDKWIGTRPGPMSGILGHYKATYHILHGIIKMPSSAGNTLGASNLYRRSAMDSIPHASGIYKILCVPTGKFYIGSSRDLCVRWQKHRSELMRGDHKNSYLTRAWHKYGADAFVFSVLELCFEFALLDREQYWLDRLRPYERSRGFNICLKAVSSLGVKRSAEYIAAQSVRARERMADPERRAAVSRVHRGKTISDAQKRAITEKLGGLKRPPEVIAKYSNARARDYILTDPDGNTYEVHNLVQFCKGRDLSSSRLCAVASGKALHHKGWLCRRK